jgi:hypothetical protein
VPADVFTPIAHRSNPEAIAFVIASVNLISIQQIWSSDQYGAIARPISSLATAFLWLRRIFLSLAIQP